MSKPVINVERLGRSFKVKANDEFVALKHIDFTVNQGEIFGLLGPNGAGKTTTIKILSTMLAPSTGRAEILGLDTFRQAKDVRKHINFVFGGEKSLYWRLSARDNLYYFADLYKIPKREQKTLVFELLEKVGLQHVSHKKVEQFSKGMKQRLQIARALLNKPRILFLDEPSIGLDPVGALELRELVKQLAKEGVTILLTTHYLPEAEELCDRIAVINQGEILAIDTVAGLQNLISHQKRQKIIKRKKVEQEQRDKVAIELTLEDIYIELLGGK